ncbi:MAG TPA: patatin-like phospholipase family protein [Flavobacteriales bacterium]
MQLLIATPRFYLALITGWYLMVGLIFPQNVKAQSVGVVLSGGGATAVAHVGFLKALEENNIPIDFICGTSMGAVVASMYASGYTVAEIDSMVRTEEFLLMATGAVHDQYRFYFKHPNPDAAMVSIRYSKGNFITNALPTNLIKPALLDWKLMETLSQADQVSRGNFDSLFVPLRCIAADIHQKKQIVFDQGPLNVAVRASCTYPFYLPPRRVNGNLLYDGGIYNNFPTDVMFMEFLPDVILGCNVSGEVVEPDETDLFSQLQSMILYRSKSIEWCQEMVIVEPQLQNIGTFDFDKMPQAVDVGYRTTLDSLSVIFSYIDRRVTLEEKNEMRRAFRSKFKPFVVDQVQVSGLKGSQNNYIKNVLGKNNAPKRIEDLKIAYFRISDDDKVKSIFPIVHYNDSTEYFRMLLDIQREKDLHISFGGNFSSRAINTGFVGLRYNLFGKASSTLSANSYFGRFYGSVSANIRLDKSGTFPLSFQSGFTFNRWDFFRSLATFFDDAKPSYILLNERFGNITISTPAGNKGTIKTDFIYSHFYDNYYQTQDFLAGDTADVTTFDAGIVRLTWERNTLNKKQYANQGTYLNISLKGVTGKETSIPGSTSAISDSTSSYHSWITGKINYTNYFRRLGPLKLGFMIEGVASTQPFFQNYIASAITAPVFNPIPESKTLFMPQFRAHTYAAGGLMTIFSVRKNIDLRMEGYVFNPFGRIVDDGANEAVYNWDMNQYYMASGSLVIHSPLGPLSVSVNYFDSKKDPWSFLFNFGYILFNRSARD